MLSFKLGLYRTWLKCLCSSTFRLFVMSVCGDMRFKSQIMKLHWALLLLEENLVKSSVWICGINFGKTREKHYRGLGSRNAVGEPEKSSEGNFHIAMKLLIVFCIKNHSWTTVVLRLAWNLMVGMYSILHFYFKISEISNNLWYRSSNYGWFK